MLQYAALRTVTGCLQITSEHHPQEETMVLPVKEHNVMLTKQFFLGCHRRSHLNFNITQEGFSFIQEKYMQDPLAALNDINRDAKNLAVTGYRMNVVLGGGLPSITDTEGNLRRKARVVLPQLRTEWSKRLNVYWSRIGRAVPNECHACGQGPRDIHHIFNCPANPTSLRPIHLWTHTVEVAQFFPLNIQINRPIA
ncbi:uncharacterized protein LOC124420855 [Lucilia cuprina]|uniref:uncharacterized protein LOC124420855 n=1 Tax=Lucilia cuprina TaxID=7375 RepID=UPI001F061AEE|nr:uncharacterized protein LOC124420855 [Lucilia cuprina]